VQVSIQRLRDQDARRRLAGFFQGRVTPMTPACKKVLADAEKK
jgi:hypothetical protein